MGEPLKNIRKCAICGKDIIVHRGAGWLYKRTYKGKTMYFCSWTCKREDELARARGINVTKQEHSELCESD